MSSIIKNNLNNPYVCYYKKLYKSTAMSDSNFYNCSYKKNNLRYTCMVIILPCRPCICKNDENTDFHVDNLSPTKSSTKHISKSLCTE